LGYKDTVIALPGQITRIKATFDKAGLYVWHCHIVEHEDNEMMRPLKVIAPDKIGVHTGGSWYLDLSGNNAWDGTPTDALYPFNPGFPNAISVTGDWSGTGTTKVGVYLDGAWYLDLNGNGSWENAPTDLLIPNFGVGLIGAVPVTGDWDGTGKTKVGVYQNGVWYLDLNGNGTWEGTPTDSLYYFGGGVVNAVPVTGDWTGDGKTKIGIYADGIWYLDLNGNGAWDGTPTDGLYFFGGGVTGAVPVTGDWNGTIKTKIGIYVPTNGEWFLDTNGNGAWDGTPVDGLFYFGGGLPGTSPVAGKW
jgi:(2Fe-2S) ferredoxin